MGKPKKVTNVSKKEAPNQNVSSSSKIEELESKLKETELKLQESLSKNQVLKEELYKKVHEALEQDLNCSICTELFIQPEVLDCGHCFCAHCIKIWTSRNRRDPPYDHWRDCPICRRVQLGPPIKQPALDSYLNNIQTNVLSPEIRDHRQQLIDERKKAAESANNNNNNNNNAVAVQSIYLESSSSDESTDSNELIENVQEVLGRNREMLSQGSSHGPQRAQVARRGRGGFRRERPRNEMTIRRGGPAGHWLQFIHRGSPGNRQ